MDGQSGRAPWWRRVLRRQLGTWRALLPQTRLPPPRYPEEAGPAANRRRLPEEDIREENRPAWVAWRVAQLPGVPFLFRLLWRAHARLNMSPMASAVDAASRQLRRATGRHPAARARRPVHRPTAILRGVPAVSALVAAAVLGLRPPPPGPEPSEGTAEQSVLRVRRQTRAAGASDALRLALGRASLDAGRHAQAEALLAPLTPTDRPGYPPAHRWRAAQLLAGRPSHAQALEALRHLRLGTPARPPAPVRQALACLFGRAAAASPAAALAVLEPAARPGSPDEASACNNLAHALLHLDPVQPERALALVERALRLDPRCEGLRETRGRALAHLDRWREAVGDLERGLAHAMDKPGVHRLLERGYRRLGDSAAAARHAAAALRLADDPR